MLGRHGTAAILNLRGDGFRDFRNGGWAPAGDRNGWKAAILPFAVSLSFSLGATPAARRAEVYPYVLETGPRSRFAGR